MEDTTAQQAYLFVTLYKKIELFIFTTKFTLDYNHYKTNENFQDMLLLQDDLEETYLSIDKDFYDGKVDQNKWVYNNEEITNYMKNIKKAFQDFRLDVYKERN